MTWNRDEYLWAATVLSSRSFPSRLIGTSARDGNVVMEGPVDPISSDPILIPVMDMLNHRPNHPVTWFTSATEISFIVETAYPANTEIFNNYGAKGNEERNHPSLLLPMTLSFLFIPVFSIFFTIPIIFTLSSAY